ncbi:MAG: hypothetical protein AAB343_01490 [Patescibacteria group bacterium]
MKPEQRQQFLDYMIIHHKTEVLEALLAQPHVWPSGVELDIPYTRIDDMNFRKLQLYVQQDGDVIVTIHRSPNDALALPLSVEFCTPGAGGGRSPRTRAVLLWLIRAMQKDEEELPDPHASPR